MVSKHALTSLDIFQLPSAHKYTTWLIFIVISIGLNLILYVENHEYIRGVTEGLGARFVIHPYNTLAFVPENGLSVATGTETYIGIKMVNFHQYVSIFT